MKIKQQAAESLETKGEIASSSKVLAFFRSEAIREHVHRIIKFGVVGVLNTLFYSVLLLSLLDIFELPSVVAVTISYVLSMAFQFVLNRHFTFQARGSTKTQIIRYAWAAVVSYLGSLAIVWQLSDVMQLPMVVVVAACAVFSALFGYLAGHFWIYR